MLRPGVDGFTASAIVLGKITALNNKVGDNPMEGTSLVKQRDTDKAITMAINSFQHDDVQAHGLFIVFRSRPTRLKSAAAAHRPARP